MTVIRSIEAKKNGEELTDQAIRGVVLGYASGAIPDYQMSAWLMAVAIRGMTLRETISLTGAMVESGERLDLSSIPGVKIDKHSSGGVGDKVTLALVPILASAGVPIAKMSGHGLGLTGGTLDKLESIPGFRSELSDTEIVDQVKHVGGCICAQSETLAPADRTMYALRDVTGTVASAPLIASSIMSKKIACGADAIILDIKVGTGAFMKSVDEARELAELCIVIGEGHGKKLSCFLTDMNQPLGREIGNANEVHEVCDLIQGKPSSDRLMELLLALCCEAFILARVEADAEHLIRSGEAWESFQAIVAAQGGDLRLLPRRADAQSKDVVATQSGYVAGLDALTIARASGALGAGRAKKDDSIDFMAGVSLQKAYGEHVEAGERMATVHSSRVDVLETGAHLLQQAFVVSLAPPVGTHIIYEHLSSG